MAHFGNFPKSHIGIFGFREMPFLTTEYDIAVGHYFVLRNVPHHNSGTGDMVLSDGGLLALRRGPLLERVRSAAAAKLHFVESAMGGADCNSRCYGVSNARRFRFYTPWIPRHWLQIWWLHRSSRTISIMTAETHNTNIWPARCTASGFWRISSSRQMAFKT